MGEVISSDERIAGELENIPLTVADLRVIQNKSIRKEVDFYVNSIKKHVRISSVHTLLDLDVGQGITSKPIIFETPQNGFTLILSLICVSKDNNDSQFAVEMCLLGCFTDEVDCNVKFYLKDSRDSKTLLKTENLTVKGKDPVTRNIFTSASIKTIMATIQDPQEQMIIDIEIEAKKREGSRLNVPGIEPPVTVPLSRALSLIREKNLYSDFTILCGGNEYRVHKFILGLSSSVFKKMFCSLHEGEDRKQNDYK